MFCCEIARFEVAGVGSGTFTQLLSIDFQPGDAGDGIFSTKVTVSDISGALASGVQFIRVTGNNNANGSSGRFIWQELYLFGDPTAAVAVSEPSTTALIGLGGLALILRRRR